MRNIKNSKLNDNKLVQSLTELIISKFRNEIVIQIYSIWFRGIYIYLTAENLFIKSIKTSFV